MTNWYDRSRVINVVVTPELLRVSMPKCKDPRAWADAFNVALEMFPVDNVAMLLAQVGHESLDLNVLEENLYYSAGRLVEVWPHRYPNKQVASQYAKNPEALANHTYGGRLGNNRPGDGWKFKGRGPIQITGRYNYTWLARDSKMPVVQNPDLLAEDKEAGAISACHYYTTRVSTTTIQGVTKQIQGGQLGLIDRDKRYKRTLRAILERG